MKEGIAKLRESICSVIVGREETIDFLLTAILADGHVLLEDMPGTGKTKLARTLAGALGAQFSRIQFTPDLLPTDLTGLHVYDQKENQFVLHRGPVFTNILLADEINRATPRTQSGLLECMEEHQVTIDGNRLAIAEPFFVIATQNPIETAGTFPLPEAQLDRFMMKLSLGLSTQEEEIQILTRFMGEDPIRHVTPVLSAEELMEERAQAARVYCAPVLIEYLAKLVVKTRTNDRIRMGVSTRGSLAMLRAARGYAYLQGRSYVIPDDIRKLAVPVFAHRLMLAYGGGKEKEARDILLAILDTVAVPTEDWKQ